MPNHQNTTRRRTDAKPFVEHAFLLARSLGVTTLVVLANEPKASALIGSIRGTERIIWVARSGSKQPVQDSDDSLIEIPDSNLSRMGQIKVGLYVATLQGHVGLDDRVLCISGEARTRRLDMLLLTQPREDFPWLDDSALRRTRNLVAPREFARLLELSLRFAAEGREGKPIGTAFVLGSLRQLRPYTRQLILNPCAGHPDRARNIHNPSFVETLRELTALDGRHSAEPTGSR